MKRFAEAVGQRIRSFLKIFYKPIFNKFLPEETYFYAVSGGLNLVLDIFLYSVFYHYVLHEQIFRIGNIAISSHIAAFILVFPITFSTGFLLAKFVTFTESQIKGTKQLIRYGISVGGSILLNYLLLNLFHNYFEIEAVMSKVITTFIVVIYSFIIQKFFTFKTGKKQLKNQLKV
jgi:putative flippase GtrA